MKIDAALPLAIYTMIRPTRAVAGVRVTDLFVRRRGQWQAVASHASLLSNGR